MSKTKAKSKVKGASCVIVNSRVDVCQIRPPGCTVSGEDHLKRGTIL